MLRRIALTIVMMFVGLVAVAGISTAAPYDPATLSVVSLGNGQYAVSGSGFGQDTADDYVTLTVSYTAPSGLRSNAALTAAAKDESYQHDLDNDGNFATVVTATQTGDVTFRAVGFPSGEAVVGQVSLNAAVATTTAGGSGVWVADSNGNSSSGWTDSVASSSGSLASTGASIVGPIAIGLAVLALGLLLLFFGTRGVIRRKGGKPTVAG